MNLHAYVEMVRRTDQQFADMANTRVTVDDGESLEVASRHNALCRRIAEAVRPVLQGELKELTS